MPIKPVTPEEAKNRTDFPDEVIAAFNELIKRNYSGGTSRVTLKEACNLIESKGISIREINKNNWLDIKELYRAAGWKVEHEYPSYDESFESYYVFTKK